ncbi:MAG: NAD-glutamate dehydrogenase [Ghiorsea sp.]
MRRLRDSLIYLFREFWGSDTPPGRIQATVIKTAYQLLAEDSEAQHGVRCKLLSHGSLHRHVMVIHCPDQAFYPDAVRTYLQKNNIQPVKLESVLFSTSYTPKPLVTQGVGQQKNSLFLVLHLAAATTENIKKVQQDIQHVLAGVHQSVVDFPSMRSELERITIYLSQDDPETAELLEWMIEDHYLFFGLSLMGKARKNMGITKTKRLLTWLLPSLYDELSTVGEGNKPGMDWLHLSSVFSHLYSSANVKAVRICWKEEDQLYSAIMIGHFSRGARYINASQLPQLKHRWQEMSGDVSLQQSAFYQREIRLLFDRAPKSLLHAVSVDQWLEPFKNIVDMNSPTRVVVSRLKPSFGNADVLLIAVNNQRFGNNIWANMQRALIKMNIELFGSEYYTVGSTQIIFVAAHAELWPPLERLHKAISQCVIFWKDSAKQALLQADLATDVLHDSLLELSQTSNLYQDQFSPEQFVRDVLVREQIESDGLTKVRLNLHHDEHQQVVEIHVLTTHDLPLGVMTEKLNAFALVTMEQSLIPFHHGEKRMHICRFRCDAPEQLHTEGLPRLSHGIQDVFNDLADHDPLNALVILCGLGVRDVLVLITLRNHLSQLMPEVSIAALSEVMVKHPIVSTYLFRIFEGKHRPSMPKAYLEQEKMKFNRAMSDVQSLKEDTWFRALESLVNCSVRSNAWRREKRESLAIKFDPSALDFIDKPAPYREIFVHGVHVDGIHLRAGPISRGGLRFSDRPTDFRTEVLELMTTQVLKNGQIVPTGAKGGFVVRDGSSPEFVLAQYHQFIHALLSITDNLVEGALVPPHGINVPEKDKADTYLVVAADKGTARYSDDANEEALSSGFWLGDAFASGGSHGYDHKVFGITAKGAWECAAHHFEQMGTDLWQDEVTAVGIGDMGGDVFGNGMLLNPKLKLVAAFNHVHIFLDPEPNVQASFEERARLFAEVKGWGSYNVDLISKGGGIFDRAAKSITLSTAMQAVLGLDIGSCSGESLIQAILKAPVDLLYNGGIGTYIKASSETDHDAQDPSNNAVRVDARALRCKVLSEGGNLGLTQASRIEFARQGGILNTDAIDNAAGVNMSDHEVNLKILLMDEPFKHRNNLLTGVGDQVAAQCLNDNREQAVALSLSQMTAVHHLPRLLHLQKYLYQEQHIFELIDDEDVMLRPVLSEWLGYEKNRVHEALDAASFMDKSVFGKMFLQAYFPVSMRKKFTEQIHNHPLARDISHTRITSYVLNRFGLTSIHYLQNLTSASVEHVVHVLLTADVLLDTAHAYQDVFSQSDEALKRWYEVQQQALNFAEGMLTLHVHMDINEHWLKTTKKALAAFAQQQGVEVLDLTDLATAVPLYDEEHQPLSKCLNMTQMCLDALPFTQLEKALRTPLWAGNDAHALRCEWLGRVQLMKLQATKGLLLVNAKNRASVLQQWENHPLQDKLHALLYEQVDMSPEEQRLRYILAMTHLSTIVDCGCNFTKA